MDYQLSPRVLVIADSPARGRAAADIVTRLSGRCDEPILIEDAIARLDAQVVVDAVLVDVSRDHGDRLDRLFERLEEAARGLRFFSVVALPPDLIDPAAAIMAHPGVTLLVDPEPSDILTAMSWALHAETRLQDVNAETRAQQLHQISEEVGRIAQLLARISAEDAHQRPALPPPAYPAADLSDAIEAVDPATIRAMIRGRRLRDHFFPGGLFADPAWDMLLDLMAARLEQQPVAVSSLCIASAVPPTTALRWIKTLADAGLFVRTADPRDRRRVFIELSDAAAAKMAGFFGAIRRASAARA